MGIAVSVLVVVGSLWAGLNFVVTTAINKSINAAMDQPGKDLVKLGEQGVGLRRDVDRLLDKLARNTLQSPPSLATKEVALEVQDAAKWATERKLSIEPSSIQKVTLPFAKDSDPASWEATIALVNLRSFVNSTLEYAQQHVIATVHPTEPETHFPPQKPGEWIEFVGADFKLDGRPDEKGYMNVDGKPLRIIQYMIVRDCKLEYRGGPVTLINVFFVNCTFVITDSPKGRLMAARS